MNAALLAMTLAAAPVSAAGDGSGKHEVVFARLRYSGCGPWAFSEPPWATDYPKADGQLILGIMRLADVDIYPHAHTVDIGDESHLRRHPFLYAVEVGHMCLSEAQASNLAGTLNRGGFLMVDDFWGTAEWDSFVRQMKLVFPDRPIRELPMEHPVFHSHFDIREPVQIPNVMQAIDPKAPTYEQDGYEHHVYGIEDDRGRLMVLILHNTDLGDAWEWAENPDFPLKMSNYAYMIAVNAIVYATTH